MLNSKIAILLSTFNGQEYISEQIDSIISQTFSNWTLYIRDDGSNDSTLDIIASYVKIHDNIFFLAESLNKGACNSYIHLMETIKSDYYMFCDQDDVWLPNKIEDSLNEMIKLETLYGNDIPLLIFSDLIVVDKNLQIISNSMWEYTRFNRIMRPEKYLYITPLATGCTMLFNHTAKLKSLISTKKALMHDSLLALSVIVNNGKMKALHVPLIYYRQHEKNVFGTNAFSNSLRLRFFGFKQIIKSNMSYFYFVNSLTKFSVFNFIFLKLEVALKIRNLI
jgi:glycosyltransferase involved in cell wall biosynthesis